MIDGRSPPLLFSLFSFFFFFVFCCRSSCLSFFAPRLSSRIPPSCHPRREKKTRALFDCVAGSCREHQEPRNGNGSCPSPHRDKDAISLLVKPACLYFVFLYNRGSVVPYLIEIPDREECYGARSEEKHRRRDSVITRDRYFLWTSRWLFSLVRGEPYVGYGEDQCHVVGKKSVRFLDGYLMDEHNLCIRNGRVFFDTIAFWDRVAVVVTSTGISLINCK